MSNQEANIGPASGAEQNAASAEAAETGARASSSTSGNNYPLAIYRPPVQYRFIQLAASVAIAAALGGLIGAVSAYGLASPKSEPAQPTDNLQAALTQVAKDVAALKTAIEASNRATTGQIAKITERFDRSEPAAKVAALTESVARIEKRLAANSDASRDITGSIPERATTAAKDQSKPQIVEGWVLRDIYRGRALVESRSGLYEITPGADLPGIGKVQTITQQNGRWVVVTPKGLIVSMR